MAGAPLGNINASKNKRWCEAINKALKQYNKGDVAQGHALDRIASRLVDMAIQGDSQEFKDSMREIGDRLDGKAHQSLSTDVVGNITVEIPKF